MWDPASAGFTQPADVGSGFSRIHLPSWFAAYGACEMTTVVFSFEGLPEASVHFTVTV